MKTRTGFSIAVLAAAILLLLPIAPLAVAQDQDNYQDPPTRAGRIGYVQGSVSFQPGGEGDWLNAVPNRPLTTGDNLWVDRDSRAEVQIGSTSIRLGPETSLTFLDLGNDVTQLRLSTGSLYFRVRRFDRDDRFEVDSPNLAFNVDQAGEFRLDVNQNGDQTVATVWHGRSEITGGAGDSYRLQAGQQGAFSGADQLSYDVGEIGDPDDFGRWALSRDQREDRIRSRQYVSEEMTGYEDLDDYGRWHEVAGYGNVWTPSGVPGDWAPYRYGNWAYVSPWGWTWVEQEPWGFAPFHYGRWASVGGSWCWVPGPVVVAVRPVYSPALVAFVGGGGFSIGIGVGGGVGWFPLGPGEVFVPWYRTSPRYVQNVNVSNTRVNVTQVTNVYNNVTVNHVTNVTYVNQRVTNSVTVVNHDTFVNARPVHDNVVRVDARQMASAQVTHDVARNIQPERQSVIGPARQVQNRPPEQAINRQVVATRQPTVVNRPAAITGAGNQRPVAPPPVRTVRAAPQTEAKPLERGARGGANPPPNNNVGARPGPPANQPGTPANRPGADNNRNAPGQPAAPGNQPGTPENNRPGADNNRNAPGQPAAPANRPGADNNRNAGQPENRPAENRPAENRPGADNNRNVPRPGAPANNRPEAPDNRPAAPEKNRPGADTNRNPGQPDNRSVAPMNRPGADNNRNVPRPGGPDNNRPAAPENRPVQPDNNRPVAPENRPGAAPNRPAQPENNRPGESVPRPPSANRPEQAPEQPRQNPNSRPDNARPDNARPDNARPDNARPETPRTQPEQPARPPETREQQAPPQNRQEPARPPETRRENPPPQNRQESAPRNENRSQPQPESRREQAPRPDARPAEPPPQRESRQPEQRNESQTQKSDKPQRDDKNNKDKPPQRLR
jgi:hypothetical protein